MTGRFLGPHQPGCPALGFKDISAARLEAVPDAPCDMRALLERMRQLVDEMERLLEKTR